MAGIAEYMRALLGVSAYQWRQGFGPELDGVQVKETRRALSGQIQPLVTTRLRWYLKDLERAQAAADNGYVGPAAQLWRAMRRDGVLAGLMGARTAGLTRLPKKYYGDEQIGDSLRSLNGSRAVFDEMVPPSEISTLDADGITLGIGVAELVPVEGRPYPVMVRLEPEFLQYRWNENRWYFNSIAGALPITPGDGQWVLHIPGSRMTPWVFGLWPALGRSFINKEHAMLNRSNYSAKLANPARAATAPIGATERERMGFIKRLIAWGTNTVFELPVGWDVKIIESNGRGIEVFQKEIDTSDNEYMVSITGQQVTTTGGAGFSNAEFPNQIREDLIEQDGESLAYTVNTQVLPQYIAANFGGPQAITSRATNMRWVTSKPKDLVDTSKTLQQLAQGIIQLQQALAASGRILDMNAICEQYGIPLEDTSKVESNSMGGVTIEPPKLAPAQPTPEGKAGALALLKGGR